MADITAQNVRDYIQASGTTGQWSNALIGSNINAARGNLQRWTGRQFEPQGSNTAVLKTFTTHGAAVVTLPGLMSATTVTLQETDLEDGTTYWLIPDKQQSGTHTAIQLRAFGRYDYRSNPTWFDRNLDHPRFRGSTLPNDLAISGFWGHHPEPPDYLQAWTILAAWYTIRTDALFSNVRVTPGGTTFDLSQLPEEVQQFVNSWSLLKAEVAVL
jgi:hypothetical protein